MDKFKPGPRMTTPKRHKPNPITKSYAKAPIFAAGKISSGKTTFLTKFGCDTITVGEAPIVPWINPRILSPRKTLGKING